MPDPWVGVTEEEARVLKELEIFMRRESHEPHREEPVQYGRIIAS